MRSFATLAEAEASDLAGRLAEREQQDDRERRDRLLRRASRPIQTKLDYLALALVPLVAWAESRSVAVAAAAGGGFAALTFLVLPWWRRRRIPPAKPSGVDRGRELAALADLCRKAEREQLDVVYEWSL